MKKQLLALAFVAAATLASYAQGTITFRNTIASRILIDPDGPGPVGNVPVPAGTAINYGVFWGSAGSTENQLQLNDGPLGTSHPTSPGLISAPSPYVIVGGAELSTVSIQIRAWCSSFGRDWQTASRTPGSGYSTTDVRQVRLAATAGPGTIIWQSATATDTTRFNPFVMFPVVCIPEPTTIGLLVLSLGSLLVFRRRRTGQ